MGRKTHGPYLIAAIEHNDHEKVGEILTSHIRPKEKVKELIYSDVKRLASEHTECPLLLAACLPDAAILGYLVKKHDVNINYPKRIQQGRRTKVKTALITAVRNGLYETVEGILGLQADANIQDHKGRSALHHAVRKADFRMAKMLLSKGANANLTDQGDNTPLHVATIFGHSELVKLLLHFGADQYKKGQHGAIPIHIAAKEGHQELLKLYSSKQMNPNIKMPCYDGREKAPLHVAAEGGHYECIALLIEQIGADINVQDSEGETPLTCCCLNEYDPMGMKSKDDYTECVQILLKHGAEINRQNGRGETALHLAARNEFHKIVDVLVQAGADPLITDNNNDKPIDLVSPEDTVSRQTLKQAQEDREHYLNDMLEIQAKGYSTSLKHIPNKSVSSLSISSSYNGALNNMGRTASMPGLVDRHGSQQMITHPVIEENYMEPQHGDNNTYANIADNSDDSYAADKNDEKSGSVNSLSQILHHKLSKGHRSRNESSDSSHYEGSIAGNKKRSKSVDVIGSPRNYQKNNMTHPNTPQKPEQPPSPPRPRDQRDSYTSQVSALTDATSVWDDSVSRTSSVSTFVPQPQKTEEKLRQIKEHFKAKGNRYQYPSDTTSQYEQLPDERPAVPQQPNIAVQQRNNDTNRTATPTMSDSDDTFFDDESFDTLSESFWKKPEIKPKPKLKPNDLKKKALANQKKEAKKKSPPKKKDNPGLQNWLSEQAQIIERRKVDGTPPVAQKRNLVAPKAEEESSTVDITASPGVKHRIKTFDHPTHPKPAPRGKPALPPREHKKSQEEEDEEKVVHVEVDEGSPGQTLIRLVPLKGGKGVAHVELPSNARNVQVISEEKENNNNLKNSMEMSSDDGLTNDSTFDDDEESDEEEDSPNSGHHAAILYDSQRQLQTPRTPTKVTAAPSKTSEKAKPKLMTFQPASTSTMRNEEPVNVQRDEISTDEESDKDEQDSIPQYATVNKPAKQANHTTKPAAVVPVAKVVPVAAPVTPPAGQVHVAPLIGQVHSVPVVGQVQRVGAVPQKVSSAETSHEQIYHEISSGGDFPTDEAKRKSVTIGNDSIIPNNVKRPADFDHRHVMYNSMGRMAFSLVGGNADGVFVHKLEAGSPAQQSGLMDGDQIMKVNDQSMKGKTKEEVSLLLNSIKTAVNLVVRHKKDRYQGALENGGMGDSFFVKARFNFADPRSDEMNIHENDIFGVRDTLPDGKMGSWLALKVNASASENQHGLIPNKNRAEQVAINQRLAAIKAKEKQQRGGLLRRSFGRSKSADRLNKSRDQDNMDFNPRDVIAYERVQQKTPEYMQPVVLLGLFCDAARDMLKQDSPGIFEVPTEEVEFPSTEESGRRDLVNMNLLHQIIHSNKHCLTIISPKAIQFLQKTDIKPIVIYLHPGNKNILKAIRNKLAPDFDRKVTQMLDEATAFEKTNKQLFTATVTYTSDDSWFTLLKDTINRIQNQPQWIPVPDDMEDEDEDEDDVDNPAMQQKLSRKMNMSCDDIPEQIADILNRHATGRPQRSDSSGSEREGIPKPPQASLTYDGYFLSNNQPEPHKEKPPPSPKQPSIEVVSHRNDNQPRSILKGSNGSDAASISSNSSAASAQKPQGQKPSPMPTVGAPVSHSSPNTTPPRPPVSQVPGQPQSFRPMQPAAGIRQAPIQLYNQPQQQPPQQPQQPPQKQRGRQRIRSHQGPRQPPPQQPQQGMHPGMQQPQGMHPGMQPPQGMHPGMQQPQGMHPGIQPPQGMHPGMQQPQGMHPGMQQPQGMHPGMQQPQGMHPGMRPGMQQPQGMRPGLQQPQGMRPGMQQHGMQQQQGMQPRLQQPQGMRPGMQQPRGMHPGMRPGMPQQQGMHPGMQQRMPAPAMQTQGGMAPRMQPPPSPGVPQQQPAAGMHPGMAQSAPKMQRQNTETTL